MLFSNDLKKLFLGVPKTGTQTALSVLQDYSIPVAKKGMHPEADDCIQIAKRKGHEIAFPLKIYAIWRDPVDRFKSSLAYLKKTNPRIFLNLFPEKFNGIDLPEDNTISPEFKQVLDTINFIDMKPIIYSNILIILRPQLSWLGYGNVTCLPYSDYDNSLRTIMTDFGIDITVDIPRLNVTDTSFIVEPTEQELEEIRNFYQYDYAYQP